MPSPEKPDAILHIGMEKTGTTALQATLFHNSEILEEGGFLYSRAAGGPSHMRLAGYAKTDDAIDRLRGNIGVRSIEDLAEFRTRLMADLKAERAEHPDKIFIFSDEHCQSHLSSRAEVQRLHDLLSLHFETVQVMLYLRRQDRVAVSRYSTRLKMGFAPASILGRARPEHPFYNYLALVERWADVFSPDRLAIGIYGPGELVDGSIIEDFRSRFGLPVLEPPAERPNVELDAIYQDYLIRMNDLLRDDEPSVDKERHERLQSYIEEIGAGRGLRPARAEAEAFYENFRDFNEALRSRFLPERDALFDEDFSQYPEDPDPPELDLDRAMEITAQVWGRLASENHQLRSALTLAKGQAYVYANRPQRAYRMLRSAVRRSPEDAQAWYFLSRACAKMGKREEARTCAEKASALAPESKVYRNAVEMLPVRAG